MSHHDTPQLHRPDETLPPLNLLQLAETTRKDVLEAVEAWEDSPPDKKYADILGAATEEA